MPALPALLDTARVADSAPVVLAAGALVGLLSATQTATDSTLLSLVELVVGPAISAGIVGVTFAHLSSERDLAFVETAKTYVWRLLLGQLLSGLLILAILLIPGLVVWSVLRADVVALTTSGSADFGLFDAIVATGGLLAVFLATLPFALVAPAVVDDHGITGSVAESAARVLERGRDAIAFGLVNGVVTVVAAGPAVGLVVLSALGDPRSLATFTATEFGLLFVSGAVTATFAPIYATAFYRRVGPAVVVG